MKDNSNLKYKSKENNTRSSSVDKDSQHEDKKCVKSLKYRKKSKS